MRAILSAFRAKDEYVYVMKINTLKKKEQMSELSTETENALLKMRIQTSQDITTAIEKQTLAINVTIKENRTENEDRFNILNTRINQVEVKANNLLIKFSALGGAMGVIAWIADKFIK